MATVAWLSHSHIGAPSADPWFTRRRIAETPLSSKRLLKEGGPHRLSNFRNHDRLIRSEGIFRVQAKEDASPAETQEILVRVRQFDTLLKLAGTFRCTVDDWVEANPELNDINHIHEGKFLRIPPNSWHGVVPDGYQGRIQAHRVPSFLKNQKTADEVARLSVHAEDISSDDSTASVGSFQPWISSISPGSLGSERGVQVLLLGALLLSGGFIWAGRAVMGQKKAKPGKNLPFSGNGAGYARLSQNGSFSAPSQNGTVRKLEGHIPVTVLGQLANVKDDFKLSAVEAGESSQGSEAAEKVPVVLVSASYVVEEAPSAVKYPSAVESSPTSKPTIKMAAQDLNPHSYAVPAGRPNFLASVFKFGNKEEKKEVGDVAARVVAVEVESATSAIESQSESVVDIAPVEVVQLVSESPQKEPTQFEKRVNAAIPAIAVGAGIAATITSGYEGAFEIMGLTALTSFATSDLLLAKKRNEFFKEFLSIRSHNDLMEFLNKRDILPKA